MRKTRAEINDWLDAKMAALGIETNGMPVVKPLPTITVYPGPHATERLAHFGADRLIANSAGYDSMCARLDAELAGLLEGYRASLPPLPCAKSTRRERVMTND